MPTNIPYDPTLVLGNIVPQDKLDEAQQRAAGQAPIDAEQERQNALRTMLRSIDMTIQEVEALGIDAADLRKQRETVASELSRS